MTDQQFEKIQRLLKHHYRIINYLQGKHFKETGKGFLPSFIDILDDAETEKIEAMLSDEEANECRVGCDVYTPDDAPEVAIYYKTTDPDIGPEIHDITVNGESVSGLIYELIEDYAWYDRIDDHLADIARDAKEDKLIENFEIKQLENGIF